MIGEELAVDIGLGWFCADAFRKAAEAMEHQVCEEYRRKNGFDPGKGVIDYLIPLGIGGEDAISNLWWRPEPDHRARHEVGEKPKSLVCSHRISLAFAQSCIQHNWVNCRWSWNPSKIVVVAP
ncbi:MAG TPA: hypothetical protein VME18_10480 [Acidobacteriaceae bacterium]|nr:hypothetical protein [Acidobacteriaceae bacterium]